MLKDRRALLEHDLKITHDEAAHMYLDIVTHNKDVRCEEFQLLRDKISKLEFDLNIINQLICKGHE